jgi:xanthine dehydrogenase accessory factor
MNTGIYAEVQTALKKGERLVMATVVKTMGAAPCNVGSKMLIRADGSMQGSLAGPHTDGKVAQEALKAMHDSKSYVTHIHLDADQGEAVGSCGATLEIFFEVLRPEPRLIIAGAGYVAQALTRLASRLDFHIVVVDERRDLVDAQAFDNQIQLTLGNIPQTIRELEPDETSWIVIVTRGHDLDEEALKAALETRAMYVGMIGSQSKVRHIFKDLLKQGVAREQLAKVHAPIGLDLGAETPDEIALSIAAEIVMLRHQATGTQLKDIHHLLDEEAKAAINATM